MDTGLQQQISILTRRGQAIFNGFLNESRALHAPSAEIGRQFFSEGAGQLASELLGLRKAKTYGKKLAAAWFRDQRDKNQQQIVIRYYSQYRSWLDDVIALLTQVSAAKTGLTVPGNSQTLVRRVAGAERYKRLDTRLRHVLTQLEEFSAQELVWNTALPQKSVEPKKLASPNPYKVLNELEQLARRYIERELAKISPNWWNERIPLEVRKRAEGRMNRREKTWPWYPSTSDNITDFLDFSDYRKVMLEPNNWNQLFNRHFGSRTFVDSKLGELEPIRHDLVHSRSLTPEAVGKLQLFARELTICMKSSGDG